MNEQMIILLTTAFTLAFTHTLMGPDHYLPFVVMGRANNWSLMKTIWITTICGFGHVISSVLIGTIGIAAGISITKLTWLEGFRGDLAGYAIILFGLAYLVWAALKMNNKLKKNKLNPSVSAETKGLTSPWWLFVIFVLGPCEVLIPLLILPASEYNLWFVFMIILTFSMVTLITMNFMVALVYLGLKPSLFKFYHKYAHVFAGITILLSGLAISFLEI